MRCAVSLFAGWASGILYFWLVWSGTLTFTPWIDGLLFLVIPFLVTVAVMVALQNER